MVLIAAGLLALGLFVLLSLRAETGHAVARNLASFEMLGLIGFGGFGVFVALLYAALGCDESCDSSSSHWSQQAAAWQWDAELLLALAGLVALVVAFVLTRRRRHGQAVISAVIAAACFGAWAALLAPLGNKFGI